MDSAAPRGEIAGGMVLPSHAAHVERSARLRAALRAFAAGRAAEPLVWCHLPRLLWIAQSRLTERHHAPVPLSREELNGMRRLQLDRRGRASAGGLAVRFGESCLFMTSTTNIARAQAPLHARFGPLREPELELRPARRRLTALTTQALDLGRDLTAFLAQRELELPLSAAALQRLLLRTAKLLGQWEDLLAREEPRLVVVGTVWQPRVRALLLAARHAGIRSLFTPTFPMVADLDLMDLGVDYAALRGEGEAALLADHGVHDDRAQVAGNPTIALQTPPAIDGSLPVVFAPSTERPGVLGPLVELIARALGDQVAVGRHPKSVDEDASAFPSAWHQHRGRTLDLLRAGPPAVLQQSSGIALEALHLGIPVIELRFPGTEPEYAALRGPQVRAVSSAAELAEAVRDAPATEDRREALMAWARRWAGPVGREAGQRMISLAERAIADGPGEPIWDSVAEGGTPR